MKHKVIYCKKCGFRHLKPIPKRVEIEDFYKNKYYQQKKITLLDFVKEKREIKWASLLWEDKLRIFKRYIHRHSKNILDIGCGNAFFLKFMQDNGWKVTGVEPSKAAYLMALSQVKNVLNLTFEEFAKKNSACVFSAINLTNVLEHSPDPRRILELSRGLLDKKHGIVCVEVPNDFSILQLQAQKLLKRNKYWVRIPDHLNYFDFKTIENLLISVGFKVVYRTTDFPMELFLLMGDNYLSSVKLGYQCHQKRMKFDLALSDDVRRKVYQSLAAVGFGRNCIVYAKL